MKKLLLISLLLMVSPFARTQFSSVMAEDPIFGDKAFTLVRNMSNSEVITYLHGINTHRFTYENKTTLMYKYIDMPSPQFDDIRVNDFRIIGNFLYFCGENIRSGCGVLGTFKTDNFYNPLGTPLYIDYYEITGTTTLGRMEAYIDPATNIPRLAAVGYDRNGSCGIWACGVWVDCEGLAPGTAPTSISVFQSYYGGLSNNELWNDVVATDNWVVLVGHGYWGGQQGLILRRFHKGMPTDPEIDNLFFYPESEAFITEEICAVSLREDDIAVAFRGIRINNVYDFTKFRLFEINSMLNINSQEYVIPYKSMVKEMAYMKGADRVVLVNEFPAPVDVNNFVYLTPYQSSAYPTVYVHDIDWFFWSVTNLDDYYFVGAGCFHFLLRDASASYPANNDFSANPPLCPEDKILNVEIIEDITPNITPIPFTFVPSTNPYNYTNPTILSSFLKIKCYSY